ncbi:hypothetical protein PRUPE_5G056100 [Prunus persica]|uniref:Peptidase C1A papain C-terminal domain-containing protein n=1 Tax=Prunus persica TaxID=3760 RepID=M5W9P9_PRUPE|nr:hypothetical protein PRUPE_5G056100 [Prunus persica]
MALTNQGQYLCLAFLFILAICSSQASSRQIYDEKTMLARHEDWMAQFGPNYFTLSLNEFADLTNEEFQEIRNGYTKRSSKSIMLTTEANHSYRGVDGTSCNTQKAASQTVSINGYEDVPKNNQNAMLQAVANQPISVAIDASGCTFQFYSNHGVTAVGYGTSSDGTKYWLVKNSWGTGWGEGGYVMMQRGIPAKEGLCGIAMEASYPTA